MKSFIPLALALATSGAFAQNTATLSFNPPTTLTDGSPLPAGSTLSFNVYQGEKGLAKTKVATVTTSPAVVSSGLATGKVYCFEVTAVLSTNNLESGRSNEACKSFLPPSAFTITVQ